MSPCRNNCGKDPTSPPMPVWPVRDQASARFHAARLCVSHNPALQTGLFPRTAANDPAGACGQVRERSRNRSLRAGQGRGASRRRASLTCCMRPSAAVYPIYGSFLAGNQELRNIRQPDRENLLCLLCVPVLQETTDLRQPVLTHVQFFTKGDPGIAARIIFRADRFSLKTGMAPH